MNRCILNLLSVGALVGWNAVPAQAAEPNSLQGTWIAVAAERNGNLAWDIKGHVLIITGDRFEVRGPDNQVLFQGTLQRVGSQRPAAIDFLHANDSLHGKTWKGIYEIQGNLLRICDNGADLSKNRPAYFMSQPDTGHVLIEFRRLK